MHTYAKARTHVRCSPVNSSSRCAAKALRPSGHSRTVARGVRRRRKSISSDAQMTGCASICRRMASRPSLRKTQGAPLSVTTVKRSASPKTAARAPIKAPGPRRTPSFALLLLLLLCRRTWPSLR